MLVEVLLKPGKNSYFTKGNCFQLRAGMCKNMTVSSRSSGMNLKNSSLQTSIVKCWLGKPW